MNVSSSDERWMRRALELAERGRLTTWPNPMVGCVVVVEGVVLGEGWHRTFGEAHAEVHALERIPEDTDLSQATAYVTLEPCSHTGKTPPCADLLVRRGVGRVVVAMTDPNPKVAGNGLARLRSAGISVSSGCLGEEAGRLNRRFVHGMTEASPWVTLKWAQSADGLMDPDADAATGRGGFALTGHAAARHTHSLRATHDAILVGMRTWLVDRPSLTTRHVPGPSPRKFVLTRGETPFPESFKGEHEGTGPAVLVHPTSASDSTALASWSEQGFELMPLESSAFTANWWKEFRRASGALACLVEGGAEVAQAVLTQGTWDEVHMLKAPLALNQGLSAPLLEEVPAVGGVPMGDDVLYVWQNDMKQSNRT